MDMTDIPHHEVELDENVTPREAALRVYRILMVGIGADGGSELLFQYLMSCFHRMKRPNEDVKLSPMHLVRGFQ